MAHTTSAVAVEGRTLSLAIGDIRLAMDSGKVLEVIQRPVMSRVPNAPTVLVGIANLRGLPLPVVDLGSLLGHPARLGFPGERVIVYDRGDAVGLLVDDVFSLSAVNGAVTLVDLEERLAAAFRPSVTQDRKWKPEQAQQSSATGITEALQSFLAFGVGGQTYGLPLEAVEQVMTATEGLGHRENGNAIAGMINFRDSVLPVIPLAGIVGLPASNDMRGSGKIVVVEYEGSIVGLEVDRIDTILRLSSDAIDAVPPILKRGAGTAELEGIGRFNAGKSLIAILSPQKLFGHAAVETTLGGGDGELGMSVTREHNGDLSVEKFLLFTLADETYGLPLSAIDEVIRLPDTLTRIPNAPDFILGVVNLRGKALPLIDQRSRFGTAAASDKPRAIVVTIGDLQAGFVVDGASEIASVPSSGVSPSPSFSSEATDVFDRVAHMEIDGRMILLVDPKALLTRAERDLVSAMTGEKPAAGTP